MAATSYTIDDFIALNDELLALVRAGVPLERGLRDAALDQSGNLRQLSQSLADDLQQGNSLGDVLNDSRNNFPPIYRAVVEAGIESANLAGSLEHLIAATRRLYEMRRVVGLALLYPLMVVTVACLLFSLFGPSWAAVIRQAVDLHRAEYLWGMSTVLDVVEVVAPYVLWLPMLFIGIGLLWWLASGWAVGAEPRRAAWLFAWVPYLGRLLRKGQAAAFCETAAMLIEHQVPLDRTIALAAGATGDARVTKAAESIAARLRQGEKLQVDDRQLRAFPPLIRWMLAGSPLQADLAGGLRNAAEDYRRAVFRLAERIRLLLPVVLTLALGGLVTLVYTFAVFIPWAGLMKAIGEAF